ncbi:DUF1826 domain-containing protein [Rhodospirillaceae bacterium KN72]|uniref:DUF1826 domain-containing protein n=1 Tax=Pacificispira spongiicola TaxID=2729598 RepID=A0A7Y0DYR7_9PROT|nr:DUF1826 domain-containing protein [Pacificispira spongiicola]
MAEATSPDILNDIWLPGRAVTIWRRKPQPTFQDWIDAVAPDRLPQGRVTLTPDRAEDAVTVLCDQVGLAPSPNRSMLTGDIAALAAIFARVLSVDLVRLRLDVVQDNACTLFHADTVPARLLCTYRGRGTEYGVSDDGDAPRTVTSLPTGSVGLFRGLLFAKDEQTGIVHRSPPIEGAGETRLLLVIDVVSENP